MSRRPKPSPRPAATAACPCGLPASYRECCGRLHRGELAAGTAEQLMRSRYSAFVVGDEAYLLRTWAAATRPPSVDFDLELRWQRLEVLASSEGGAFHSEGTVTFRAHFVHQGEEGVMSERSAFVRENGAWVYRDALELS